MYGADAAIVHCRARPDLAVPLVNDGSTVGEDGRHEGCSDPASIREATGPVGVERYGAVSYRVVQRGAMS